MSIFLKSKTLLGHNTTEPCKVAVGPRLKQAFLALDVLELL